MNQNELFEIPSFHGEQNAVGVATKMPRQYAAEIIALRSRQERIAALAKVPEHLQGCTRTHVENYFALWPIRRRLVQAKTMALLALNSFHIQQALQELRPWLRDLVLEQIKERHHEQALRERPS